MFVQSVRVYIVQVIIASCMATHTRVGEGGGGGLVSWLEERCVCVVTATLHSLQLQSAADVAVAVATTSLTTTISNRILVYSEWLRATTPLLLSRFINTVGGVKEGDLYGRRGERETR